MSTSHEQHLTDDQFADLFIGAAATGQVQQHLETCEQCRAEVATFSRSVENFSGAAMQWSESQPTFSPRSVHIGSLKVATTPRRMFAQAGWVMAGALVLFVSGPGIWRHEHTVVAMRNAAVATSLSTRDDSAEQIAQDNDLMQSVNMALQTEDPSPFREYQIPDVTGKRARGSNGVRNQ